MSDSKAKAQELKGIANKAFSSGNFQVAIENFTAAIELDPTDHVFFSNRSASYASLGNFTNALEDGNTCVKLKPDFAKGYSRVAAAHVGLKNFNEAEAAYQKALSIEPENSQYKEGLNQAKASAADASNPMKAMFGPQMWPRLQSDPTTREYLKDPAFVQKMQLLSSNPNMMSSLMQSDPRMSAALGVILGINLSAPPGARSPGGGATKDQVPMEDGFVEDDDEEIPAQQPTAAASRPKPEPTPAPKPAPAPAPELSPEEKAAQEKKQKAISLKDQGNAFYSKRQFAEAMQLYEQALVEDPTFASVLSNISAVKFEQKDFDGAIEFAQKALEVAREHKTMDYKAMAKVWLRIANAYMKKNDLDNAKEAVGKSLIEHYDTPAKKLQKEIEAAIKIRNENAYLDETKSEEAKERGAALFKAEKWPEAIAEFTEAIKRNPKNYKVYCNRAAAYMKLMEWPRALEDGDKSIAIEPTFVKGYVRKANAQKMLKQYKQANDTIAKGLQIEPDNAELIQARS